VHDREHDNIVVADLVQDAVGVQREFPHIVVAEFGDDLTDPGQLVEQVGLLAQVLGDLLGVVSGVVCDEIVDGAQIGFGLI